MVKDFLFLFCFVYVSNHFGSEWVCLGSKKRKEDKQEGEGGSRLMIVLHSVFHSKEDALSNLKECRFVAKWNYEDFHVFGN